MTSKIKCLIRKRNMAFKNKKIEPVKNLRKNFGRVRKAKISFYGNKLGPNLRNCPKSWWKYIK